MAKWLNPSLAFEHDMCSVHSHCLPYGYTLHGLDSSLLISDGMVFTCVVCVCDRGREREREREKERERETGKWREVAREQEREVGRKGRMERGKEEK